MAPSQSPVEFVQTAVEKLHARMVYYLKTVWKRIRSLLSPLKTFLKKLITGAKAIAKTVGKPIINQITSAARSILTLMDQIEKVLKSVVKLGKRLLDMLRNNLDLPRVIRVLKTVIRKYVDMIRKVWGWVREIVTELGLLDAALSVVGRFTTVLQLVFRWIRDLTGIVSAVKRVKGMLKKVIKTLKVEVKEAIRLLKDVAKLPVPKAA